MAAPTIGYTKATNPTSNGTSIDIPNVSVNSGNDRILVLFLTTPKPSGNVNGTHNAVTYGGQTMTNHSNITRAGGLSSRMSCWYIVNPTSTQATVTITFGGTGLFGSISCYFQAFTNCGGLGQKALSGGATSPRTGTLTVEQDSLIVTTSTSGALILTMQIPDGTNKSFVTHNTGKQVGIAFSESTNPTTGFNAGTISLRTTAANSVSLDRFEIKGLGGSGSSRRRIIIC